MDMRKIVSALMGVMMVFAVGACAPTSGGGSADEPAVDFWGNPVPKDGAGQAACAVPSGPAAKAAPYMGGRPADVLPGNSWIVFELASRALPPNEGANGPYGYVSADYCVPINVHVYTRPGEADTVQIDQVGFEAGPFDFVTTTPWIGRYVGLQYDPTEERFAGRPPSYEVHLQVRYDRERDLDATADPEALSCSIRVGVGIVNPIAYDIAIMPERTAVECVLKSNEGWNLY
jgi:hypothetical protein